jgi:hypothetical protein
MHVHFDFNQTSQPKISVFCDVVKLGRKDTFRGVTCFLQLLGQRRQSGSAKFFPNDAAVSEMIAVVSFRLSR